MSITIVREIDKDLIYKFVYLEEYGNINLKFIILFRFFFVQNYLGVSNL